MHVYFAFTAYCSFFVFSRREIYNGLPDIIDWDLKTSVLVFLWLFEAPRGTISYFISISSSFFIFSFQSWIILCFGSFSILQYHPYLIFSISHVFIIFIFILYVHIQLLLYKIFFIYFKMFDFFTLTRNVGVLFYIDTQQRAILCRYIKVHRDARLYRYKTTYDFISIRQRTTLYVNRVCAHCSARVAEMFSFCVISQWHTTWNLRRGKIRTTKLGEWKPAIFLERPFRIFPSRILPRARLWYARHACMLFGEEPRGGERGRTKFRSASRANATFYYERRREVSARSVKPKRPSASIFCPRQRFFLVSPPLIPRRSSFTGAGTSRCISLVQLFSLYS